MTVMIASEMHCNAFELRLTRAQPLLDCILYLTQYFLALDQALQISVSLGKCI